MSRPIAVLYDVPGPRARRREQIGGTVSGVFVAFLLALVAYKLWQEEQFTGDKWEFVVNPDVWEQMGYALSRTVRAAIIAILLAVVFGLVFAVGRLSEKPWLRIPAATVVEFFRAVPLLMLILFLSIGFSNSFEAVGDSMESAVPEVVGDLLGLGELASLGPLVIGLMLYNGSVLAEVFRAGILAVPRGQAEAAYAIGMPKSLVMRTVLLPQATRIMLPAIVSQCVVALKDTALGYVIAYEELVRYGKNLYEFYDNIIPTMIVIAAIYIGLNMSVSRIATWLEARQSRRYGHDAVAQAEDAVTPA